MRPSVRPPTPPTWRGASRRRRGLGPGHRPARPTGRGRRPRPRPRPLGRPREHRSRRSRRRSSPNGPCPGHDRRRSPRRSSPVVPCVSRRPGRGGRRIGIGPSRPSPTPSPGTGRRPRAAPRIGRGGRRRRPEGTRPAPGANGPGATGRPDRSRRRRRPAPSHRPAAVPAVVRRRRGCPARGSVTRPPGAARRWPRPPGGNGDGRRGGTWPGRSRGRATRASSSDVGWPVLPRRCPSAEPRQVGGGTAAPSARGPRRRPPPRGRRSGGGGWLRRGRLRSRAPGLRVVSSPARRRGRSSDPGGLLRPRPGRTVPIGDGTPGPLHPTARRRTTGLPRGGRGSSRMVPPREGRGKGSAGRGENRGAQGWTSGLARMAPGLASPSVPESTPDAPPPRPRWTRRRCLARPPCSGSAPGPRRPRFPSSAREGGAVSARPSRRCLRPRRCSSRGDRPRPPPGDGMGSWSG